MVPTPPAATCHPSTSPGEGGGAGAAASARGSKPAAKHGGHHPQASARNPSPRAAPPLATYARVEHASKGAATVVSTTTHTCVVSLTSHVLYGSAFESERLAAEALQLLLGVAT